MVVLKQVECGGGIRDWLWNTLVWISSFRRKCLIPHINMLGFLTRSEVTLISYTTEGKVCTSAWSRHFMAGIMANFGHVTFHFKRLEMHRTDATAGRWFLLIYFYFLLNNQNMNGLFLKFSSPQITRISPPSLLQDFHLLPCYNELSFS